MDNTQSQDMTSDGKIPSTRENPYVGPRPFHYGETIFGRDREVRDLFDQLIADQIVLLHSPSGAGKTSLVQAGLIPLLQKEGFLVLPPIRVGSEPPPEFLQTKNFNRYVYNLLLALDSGLSDEQQSRRDQLAGQSIQDYRKLHPIKEDSPLQVLIFDQFEEIITSATTDREGKLAFFDQLGDILRGHTVWALFIIRDDFLGALEPYTLSVPTQLTNTFPLDFLDSSAALQAIQKPVDRIGITFENTAAQKLVDDLRMVQAQLPGGEMTTQLGPYVEPVQLQVVCLRLFEKLDLAHRADKIQIDDHDVSEVGDVNRALAQYYNERVSAIAAQTGTTERAIRAWFEDVLITKSGLRGQLMLDHEISGGLDNRVIRLLEDAHLVRAEKRRGVTWIELVHDRLVKPVLEDNSAWEKTNLSLLQRQAAEWYQKNESDQLLLHGKDLEQAELWAAGHPGEVNEIDQKFLVVSQKWKLEHLSPLQRQAQDWESQGRPQSMLLRGAELDQAKSWAAEHNDELTGHDRDLLEISRQAAEQEERARREQEIQLQYERARAQEQTQMNVRLRRRAVVLSIVATLALAMAAIAIFAMASARINANKNAILLATNSVLDATNANVAFTSQTQAAQSNVIAGQQSTLAAGQSQLRSTSDSIAAVKITQEFAARIEKATAVFNARQAVARQFASQAKYYLDSQLDLATLLSIEAYRTFSSTWDTRSALLASLQTGISQSIQPYALVVPTEIEFTNSLDISPDGKTIAWSGPEGKIILWDIAQKKVVKSLQNPFPDGVVTQAFSPIDSNLLVTGGENSIIFWNLKEGTSERKLTTTVAPQRFLQGKIRGLAFSFDGKRLGVFGSASNIEIWDVATRSQLRYFTIEKLFFWKMDWSRDDKYLAVAGSDNRVYIMDPEGGSIIDKIYNPEGSGNIFTVEWLPDGKRLAFAGTTGNKSTHVYLYDITAQKILPDKFQFEGTTIYGLAFNSDGTLLAEAGWKNPVYIWNLKQNSLMARLSEYGSFQHGLSISKNFLAFLGSNSMSVYTLVTPELLSQRLPSVKGQIIDLGIDRQGNLWAASVSGRSYQLQNLKNNRVVYIPPKPGLAIDPALTRIVFSANSASLVTGAQGKAVQVLDPGTGLANPIIKGALTNPTALAVSQDGRYIAASSCPALTADNQPQEVCISQVQVWSQANGVATGAPVTTTLGSIASLAFSPDGAILALGSQDGTVAMLDWKNGAPNGLPFSGLSTPVTSLAFSPDGEVLATGTDDGLLYLWDVKTGQILGQPFNTGNVQLTSLAYSQDGKTLYAGSINGNMTAWDVDFDSWVQRACKIAGRNFTPAELIQFFPDQKNPPPTCPNFSP
jgi:WD40 repeat protein